MAQNVNVAPVPPPITTPMHTRASVDQATEAGEDQGLCTMPWIMFWQSLHAAQLGLTEAYTVVWVKQTAIVTAELVPSYIVLANREGVPASVGIRARIAPPHDVHINFTLTAPAGMPVVLLASDAVIPAGSTAVVIVSNFAVAPRMTEGYVIDLVINADGGASVFTAELMVKRS